MELTEGQKNILKRVTGKEEVTIDDYYKTVESLVEDVHKHQREIYGSDSVEEGKKIISKIGDMVLQGVDHFKNLNSIGISQRLEYILCSAIHFDDDKPHVHSPENILSGFVICGRRHHNCFAQIASLGVDRKQMLQYKVTQGFLTSEDRFLDRGQALIVAHKAGQTDKCIGELFSEDLW